jgi:hypothetical protein
MLRWVQDHSLSLAFALLFLASVAAQSVSGHFSYNSELSMYGLAPVGYFAYLTTGDFLDGIFANWQAAVLQIFCLIVFGRKLREKGAAHSLKPKNEQRDKRKEEQDGHDRPWIYRNSLSVAFAVLFGLCFAAHLVLGAMNYNGRLHLIGKPPVSISSYSLTSNFWFTNFQTWEAEFAVIGIYVVFSIFLREQGSPESKPVDSSDKQTGETNH